MKKVALLLTLFTLLLSACAPGASPTLTDAEMATRVAAILTNMPSNTPQATQVPTNTPVTPVTPQPTPRIVHDTPQASNTPLIVTETVVSSTQEASAATRTPKTPKTPTITKTPSDTEEPSATPPAGDPRTTLGNPTISDPMDNPDKSTWPVGKDKFTNNGFEDGHMWLTGLSFKPGWVISANHVDDAYIEETVKTEGCSGSDNYGIIFRVPVLRTADRGYLFAISCEGKYSIWAWDGRVGTNGTRTVLIDWKTSKAIHSGSNQTNRVGVWAQDTKLTLYVNGVKLDETKSSTFSQGYVGLFINPDVTTKFTVDVNEMKIWNTAP